MSRTKKSLTPTTKTLVAERIYELKGRQDTTRFALLRTLNISSYDPKDDSYKKVYIEKLKAKELESIVEADKGLAPIKDEVSDIFDMLYDPSIKGITFSVNEYGYPDTKDVSFSLRMAVHRVRSGNALTPAPTQMPYNLSNVTIIKHHTGV